ncbi:MAG: ABC transporter permease [Armatimonadota bacterium]|nr:ABC transporter permease [Armatimonadota bacterium]MDR7528315.1 ABC transporter permease [Armatimonadota bacterium]MDR7543708.1 ABC transporter permease [Armatimonadota bacterium]MDR7573754.1 ABC transporter permease [Armatimonadota bacterium]MDR7584676.1 ABC transporter permease [Armatimonadota bacterium]
MSRYIAARLVQTALAILLVSVAVFVLVRLRGDPAALMAPPWWTAEQVDELRRAWGFDRPIHMQYIDFLSKAVRGDFGESFRFRRPTMDMVLEKLPWTYLLAGTSALLALLIAVPLGTLSAVHRNSIIDLLSTALATVGAAMPNFWIGLMLILFFAVSLRVLPAFGAESWHGLLLPSITLGTGIAARLARLTRSAMLEVLGQDFVRTARAKGLAERVVIYRHALRNALIPVVTAFGLQLGWLLGGAVVVEQVFAWPGLGRLMIEAIGVRDVLLIQAGVFWFALSFLLINLGIDLLYTFLDPRIRYG